MNLENLKKLNLSVEKFAIFGSGPLAIRGMRESQDIDIVVKPELWDELAKKYPLAKENLISVNGVEIYKNWLPWLDNVDLLIDGADAINGWRFVNLEHVLAWKKARGEEKDIKDIELIERYLKDRGADTSEI